MRLIDCHAHLQASAFDDDAPDVIRAARSAGVERLLVPGWNVESSRDAIALAEADPLRGTREGILAGAGIHPHEASASDEAARSAIAEMARHPLVAAIGETGLDYDRGFSPRDAQLDNLRWHLQLALETGKPAILHCRSKAGMRDAQDDLLVELAAAFGDPGSPERACTVEAFGARPPAVLHSFSGPVDYAERAIELGLAVSFSGLVFRKGEEASFEVMRRTPLERLVVETDAPYLQPPGAPRRRNTPEWVAVTARRVAEERGIEPDLLGDAVVEAHDRLFGRAFELAFGSATGRATERAVDRPEG